MEEKGINPAEVDGLIARFQSGDDSVFPLLCDRYAPMLNARVHSYFGYYFKEAELDLEEMMQDARLALFRAIARYKLANGGVTFGLYARACVNNALTSYCRSHKRTVPLASIDEMAEELVAESTSPLDSMVEEEKLAQLYLKIKENLSPLECLVFDLHVEGENVKTIAKKLGESEKKVSNALYRMQSKLRAIL